MRTPTEMNRKPDAVVAGLTMLELVIVLGVLAVLAVGLLAPTFRRTLYTSSRAPRHDCLNNLRQIGVSLMTYAADHRDKWPLRSLNDLRGLTRLFRHGRPSSSIQGDVTGAHNT
jgi:Tfp pilus assembly protein PilE